MTLPEHLARLEASGLIHLAQLLPEVAYLFRHALVQEAAYGSLVRIDRRRLHQAAGEALEALYAAPHTAPELAPALAHHFAEAGDTARALRYYTAAGHAAAAVYANMEAEDYYCRALELALARGEREAVVDLSLRRGRVLELSAQDGAALAVYQALEDWAAARHDRRARLAGLNARATIYVKPSTVQDQALGLALAQQAAALARDLGERPAEARALWNQCQHYLATGHYPEAVALGEQALRLARELDDREQVAYVLTDLVKVYFMVDRTVSAWEALGEARGLWRALGQQNMLADNLATTSMVNIISGDYDEALAIAGEAVQVSRAIGNLWNESYAHYMLDMLHFDRGDIGRALAEAETCRRLAGQAGFSEGLSQTSFNLGVIYSYLNDIPRALQAVRESETLVDGVVGVMHTSVSHVALTARLQFQQGQVETARATLAALNLGDNPSALKGQFYLIYLMYTLALSDLALADGQPQRVLAWTADLAAHLRPNKLRLFLADVLYLRGMALLAAGRAEEAAATFEDARVEAEALGSRRLLWQIYAAQAALAEARGDHSAALALREQAAELIDDIAAHTGDPALTASFLSRPDVRAVIGKE